MTGRLKVVHLLDDLAVGGVTRALDIYAQPEVAAVAQSIMRPVQASWRTASQIDAKIIVTHFPPSWNKLPFLMSLKFRNPEAMIIHVEHSYNREWMESEVQNQSRFKTMLQHSLGIFDHVIFVSKAQAEWAASVAELSGDKYSVIEPFCSTPGLGHIKLPCVPRDQPLTIGTYGRMVHAKGFHDLIMAFSKMKERQKLRLLLGGFGPNESQLRSMASGIPEIRLYGKVTDHADFFRQCDVFAVPSHYECYGMVATEAKIAGRPILVSPVGGLPEQVGDAGLCIDFKRHDEAALALSNLQRMPLTSMAVAARKSCIWVGQNRARKWQNLFCQFGNIHGSPAKAA